MTEKQRVTEAVRELWAIIRAMPSPREGAKALAGAHVMLLEAEGVKTEGDVRARLRDSENAIIDTWRDRAGLDITH